MKKTIYLSLVVFLFILGCSKSDDSSINQDENLLKSGIVERNYPMVTTGIIYIPVICDGGEIDKLKGSLDIFCRMFGYYDAAGKFHGEWKVQTFEGNLTSTNGSGEVFAVKGSRKIDVINTDYTLRANIKGDKGTHYILSGFSNTLSPTDLIIERATCPQMAGEE